MPLKARGPVIMNHRVESVRFNQVEITDIPELVPVHLWSDSSITTKYRSDTYCYGSGKYSFLICIVTPWKVVSNLPAFHFSTSFLWTLLHSITVFTHQSNKHIFNCICNSFGINLMHVCSLRHPLLKSMQKTSQFKAQCKGDISHAFKTAKIIVFDPVMCKSPDVRKTSCYNEPANWEPANLQ